eukprot:663848-Pyramimonas_sp.AAC.1
MCYRKRAIQPLRATYNPCMYCAMAGMKSSAKPLTDPAVLAVAERVQKTPAQVRLRDVHA